jgi:hypothetical protein
MELVTEISAVQLNQYMLDCQILFYDGYSIN